MKAEGRGGQGLEGKQAGPVGFCIKSLKVHSPQGLGLTHLDHCYQFNLVISNSETVLSGVQ